MENTNLSDKSREALKSGTWTEMGDALRKEIVREYLQTGYADGEKEHEIQVSGITYKVLDRGEVTTFYDSLGNTLFSVENMVLEERYGEVENETTQSSKEENDNNPEEESSGPVTPMGKTIETIERQAFEGSVEDAEDAPNDEEMIPMGTASLVDIVKGLPAPTEEEIQKAKEENSKNAVEKAREKLNKELKEAKDKTFAEPVITHLLDGIKESESLAADICQKHKTWNKCFDYIYAQARKQAVENRAAVRDDVVYEWAEDYYRKDDKAEEEKKAKQEAERKKKEAERKKKAVGKKSTDRKNPEKPVTEPTQKPEKKENMKKKKDMEGQLDMFSMMGL